MYEKPEMKILYLETADVVTISYTGTGNITDLDGQEPAGGTDGF